MFADISPLYLFYGLAAVAAVLVGEALYLVLHNANSYRSRVNRRLQISGKEPNREKVLVQLRRERGLSADGDHLLPLASLNRLIVQSGLPLTASRFAPLIGGGGVVGFLAANFATGNLIYAVAAGL